MSASGSFRLKQRIKEQDAKKKFQKQDNEILVFYEALFDTPHIESELDMLLFLDAQPFEKFTLDDQFRVAIDRIRIKFPDVDGLFVYEFIPGQGARRVCPVKQEGAYFVIEDTNMAKHPFFVKTNDFEAYRSNLDKFFTFNESVDCEAMRAAIQLATTILKTDRCCNIMLNYNLRDSTIDDVFVEFSSHRLGVTAGRIVVKNATAFSLFDLFDANRIVLDEKLIDRAKRISPGQDGFKRLVVFLAVTLLHESSHWKSHFYANDLDIFAKELTCPFKVPEAGLHFENELLEGMLDLNITGEEIRLTLVHPDHRPIVILSPSVDVIRDKLCAGQPAEIRPKTSSTTSKEAPANETPTLPLHSMRLTTVGQEHEQAAASTGDGRSQTTDDQPTYYRYKLQLMNTSDITAYLPAGDAIPFPVMRLTAFQHDNGGERKQLLPWFGNAKFLTYQSCDKVAVAPGESRNYVIDMAQFYKDLDRKLSYEFSFKFQCAFYDTVGDSPHRYSSNTETLFAFGSMTQSDRPTRPLDTITSQLNIQQSPLVKFRFKEVKTYVERDISEDDRSSIEYEEETK